MADGAPIAPTPAAIPPELLIWLSPAFPTGGFAFSHGLERLVEAKTVTDRAGLEGFLRDLAAHGGLGNDLILLVEAWQAASTGDAARLDTAAEIAAALQPTAERRLESLTQGGAFAAAVLAAWPCDTLARLASSHAARLAYPVAVGTATGARGIDLDATLDAFALSVATNLVSAAIRLSVVGQFDGQRVIAAVLDDLRAAARRAATSTLHDLGTATFATDLASMEHETQQTRLFRS